MSKPTLLIALLTLAVGGLVAAPAGAATPNQIIRDCSTSPTGLLTKQYSKSDLRAALKEVSGDLSEYSGCPDAINDQLSARPRPRSTSNGENGGDTSGGGGAGGFDPGSGGSTGGTTAGGGFDSGSGSADGATTGAGGVTADGSAAATGAPATQPQGSSEPVKLAGATITPGFGAPDGSDRSLPTPLIVFLALLAAGAVAIAVPTIGRRVLARRRS